MSRASFSVCVITIVLRFRATATTCLSAAMAHRRVLPRAWVLWQALLLALCACVAAMACAAVPLTSLQS